MAEFTGDTLYGRIARVTLAIPVSTPGDFSHTTTDQFQVNGGENPSTNDFSMRIQFKISKNEEKDPNTSQIVITNLSPIRRASLQRKGLKVSLDAGYQATGLARIFYGDVRTVDQVREGSDWNTVIKLGDGERALRYARLAESYAAGTPASAILQRLVNASGLSPGNSQAVAASLTKVFQNGYVVHGPVNRSLDAFLKGFGYVWSVQDGAVQILQPGQVVTAAIPQIDSTSGLIGSPEMGVPEKKGKPSLVKYTSLMRPCRPGSKEKLVSARYDGYVRVKKVEFSGDTHGNDWYVSAEGVITQ